MPSSTRVSMSTATGTSNSPTMLPARETVRPAMPIDRTPNLSMSAPPTMAMTKALRAKADMSRPPSETEMPKRSIMSGRQGATLPY